VAFLAEDQTFNVNGVILPVTENDGTSGLSAIKNAGGITFAQDLSSVKYDGMPSSAVVAESSTACFRRLTLPWNCSVFEISPSGKSQPTELIFLSFEFTTPTAQFGDALSGADRLGCATDAA
jgi:hypothetical protein